MSRTVKEFEEVMNRPYLSKMVSFNFFDDMTAEEEEDLSETVEEYSVKCPIEMTRKIFVVKSEAESEVVDIPYKPLTEVKEPPTPVDLNEIVFGNPEPDVPEISQNSEKKTSVEIISSVLEFGTKSRHIQASPPIVCSVELPTFEVVGSSEDLHSECARILMCEKLEKSGSIHKAFEGSKFPFFRAMLLMRPDFIKEYLGGANHVLKSWIENVTVQDGGNVCWNLPSLLGRFGLKRTDIYDKALHQELSWYINNSSFKSFKFTPFTGESPFRAIDICKNVLLSPKTKVIPIAFMDQFFSYHSLQSHLTWDLGEETKNEKLGRRIFSALSGMCLRPNVKDLKRTIVSQAMSRQDPALIEETLSRFEQGPMTCDLACLLKLYKMRQTTSLLKFNEVFGMKAKQPLDPSVKKSRDGKTIVWRVEDAPILFGTRGLEPFMKSPVSYSREEFDTFISRKVSGLHFRHYSLPIIWKYKTIAKGKEKKSKLLEDSSPLYQYVRNCQSNFKKLFPEIDIVERMPPHMEILNKGQETTDEGLNQLSEKFEGSLISAEVVVKDWGLCLETIIDGEQYHVTIVYWGRKMADLLSWYVDWYGNP